MWLPWWFFSLPFLYWNLFKVFLCCVLHSKYIDETFFIASEKDALFFHPSSGRIKSIGTFKINLLYFMQVAWICFEVSFVLTTLITVAFHYFGFVNFGENVFPWHEANPGCSRAILMTVCRRGIHYFKSEVISGAFCFFFCTERWNKSVRMRPGQGCGSRWRGVLRRLHLPNSKTLRAGSWEGAYTKTFRGTDCNIPQEWHGLTDCRGKQDAM